MKRGIPFVSVDTKKKELVGNFKNAGREWHLEGNPEETKKLDARVAEERKTTEPSEIEYER